MNHEKHERHENNIYTKSNIMFLQNKNLPVISSFVLFVFFVVIKGVSL